MSLNTEVDALGGLYITTKITSGSLIFTISTSHVELQYDNRVLWLTDRPAPMSVYNGILRSYFLLGTKINFASNNDEKIVDHIICFHAITNRISWSSMAYVKCGGGVQGG